MDLVNGRVEGLEVISPITEALKSTVQACADQGKGFGFGRVVSKEGQLDIASLESDQGRMGRFIQETVYPEDPYRVGLFRWLLRTFACYVEYPVQRMWGKDQESRKVDTYEKFIATSNLEIAGNWVGIELNAAKEAYGMYMEPAGYNRADGLSGESDGTIIMKLTNPKTGRRVVRPKTELDLSIRGMRVTPLVLLESYVDRLQFHLRDKMVCFTYQKDNKQEIEIHTTFNRGLLEDIYGVSNFVDGGLVAANTEHSSEIDYGRGYIRIIKVGASKVNDSPTRSLNLTRIVGIEFDSKPDTSFINVDASTITPMFLDEMNRHLRDDKYFVKLVDELSAQGIDHEYWFDIGGNRKGTPDYDGLSEWVSDRTRDFGSGFQQSLHRFMETNTDLFPLYKDGPGEALVIESAGESIGFL